MLIAKTNPSGIDWYIGQLQSYLYTKITDGGIGYKSHPRCYRNAGENGFVAENYAGSDRYEDVYYDNSQALSSFFGVSNSVKVGVAYQADVHLVFFVNLSLLSLKDSEGSTVTHRGDEELVKLITNHIGKTRFGFTLTSVDRGVDSCLREYPGSRRDNRMKFADMHPGFCVRFNFQISYNPNKIC